MENIDIESIKETVESLERSINFSLSLGVYDESIKDMISQIKELQSICPHTATVEGDDTIMCPYCHKLYTK